MPGSRTGLSPFQLRRLPTHAGTHASDARLSSVPSPQSLKPRRERDVPRTTIRSQRIRDATKLSSSSSSSSNGFPPSSRAFFQREQGMDGRRVPRQQLTRWITYFPFLKIFFLAFSHRLFSLIDGPCLHHLRLSFASAGVGRAGGDPRLLRWRPGVHRR